MLYSCVWVPGTLDRVRVSLEGLQLEKSLQMEGLQAEWSLGEVFKLLGTRAVHDLYLRGRASGRCDAPLAWPLRLNAGRERG